MDERGCVGIERPLHHCEVASINGNSASTEAMKTAADLLLSEMKKQIQDELFEKNKPLSDSEMRKTLDKRLIQYRRSLLGSGG